MSNKHEHRDSFILIRAAILLFLFANLLFFFMFINVTVTLKQPQLWFITGPFNGVLAFVMFFILRASDVSGSPKTHSELKASTPITTVTEKIGTLSNEDETKFDNVSFIKPLVDIATNYAGYKKDNEVN